MRYVFILLMVLASMNTSRAQIFEVGPYLGGSNFVGDVGATTYIRPNQPLIGVIGKWNRSPRHSWRATFVYTKLKADDEKSNQGRRRIRGYSFSSNMLEATLGIEFDFWEWDIYSRRKTLTPYISSGISGYLTDKVNWDDPDSGGKLNKTGLALPMILGVKTNLLSNLNLAFEVGARIAFENDLDGSQAAKFGNPNNFDWYVFSGFTITYTFGRRLCYDVY